MTSIDLIVVEIILLVAAIAIMLRAKQNRTMADARTVATATPELKPMPGRVIVKLVERLDKVPGSELLLDDKYQYQPYCGSIIAIGEPLSEQERILAVELQARRQAGELAVFTWGSGSDYTTRQMLEFPGRTRADKPRFEWLVDLRVFRILDFAATIAQSDELGGSNVEPAS